MSQKYYEYYNNKYESIIDPSSSELPKENRGPCIDAGSPEAKIIIMDVFSKMKRGMGL